MGRAELIAEAARALARARRCVALTGAGVSAESGVATFRDADTGLYGNIDPMKIATAEGFRRDPGLVWRWYMGRFGKLHEARPNDGHRALSALAARFERFTLVTQNVDDLHERAGSVDVLHLHGSIARYKCVACAKPHALSSEEEAADRPPACVDCGRMVRPDVVWFGEPLPTTIFAEAERACVRAEAMIVAGTSGVVFPAAELPFVAKRAGAFVIDVNPEETPISRMADLHLEGPSGELLPQLLAAFERARREIGPS